MYTKHSNCIYVLKFRHLAEHQLHSHPEETRSHITQLASPSTCVQLAKHTLNSNRTYSLSIKCVGMLGLQAPQTIHQHQPIQYAHTNTDTHTQTLIHELE